MNPMIQELITQLSGIIANSTATAIATKVRSAKAKNDASETINELSDIISQLVDENSQLRSISQSFKQELVSQTISKEDIDYITDTLIPLVRTLASYGDKTVSDDVIALMQKLVSKEMLNVLQLLGFNFKDAIGQPLTELIAAYISKAIPSNNLAENDAQLLLVKYQLALVDIAKDEEAYERYKNLTASAS